MDAWSRLSRAEQGRAREIRTWANGKGAAVSVSQIAGDLETWEYAHGAGRLPAGTPLVEGEPEPAATTPLGREASLAAYRILRAAGENATWPLRRGWRKNDSGDRVWFTLESGTRWTYLGDGEFRLSVSCDHCDGWFGVSGVVDATTYHRREQTLRRHHGTCPDCRPLLADCADCGRPHVPAADRGRRCRPCHKKAAGRLVDEATRAAHEATLPQEEK